VNNYRGSKKRLFILLTNFAILMYSFVRGNGEYNILGLGILVLLSISMYDYWRNVE